MALAGDEFSYHTELAPELEPAPPNPLRVYHDFAQTYLTEAPIRQFDIVGEPQPYDYLSYCGVVSYDNPQQESLQLIIRESSQAVAANEERVMSLPWSRRTEVDPAAYLVATTDGQAIIEWRVAEARWKLAPAYWKGRGAGHDELALRLLSVGGTGDQEAYLWLSRQGGTFRRRGQNDSGWLVGEGQYQTGPHFLDDPVRPV